MERSWHFFAHSPTEHRVVNEVEHIIKATTKIDPRPLVQLGTQPRDLSLLGARPPRQAAQELRAQLMGPGRSSPRGSRRRNCARRSRWPARTPPGTGSPPSSGCSTPGARHRYPRAAHPGRHSGDLVAGDRGNSSTLASPTPRPEGLNRLVKQVKRFAAGSATSRTSTAEYGSTAPAPCGQQQQIQDHCPTKIVEPE